MGDVHIVGQGHGQGVAAPEIGGLAGKDGQPPALPIVSVVEIPLNRLDVGSVGLIGHLLEQGAHRQFVLLAGPLGRVHVEIQAQDRGLVIPKCYQFLHILFCEHLPSSEKIFS
ncbi:MAG TPA: hypothetical protein ENJ31_02170 [Anaerolineae bacterium]|nr:hypothetical protein [Anaerolineae bacterium]